MLVSGNSAAEFPQELSWSHYLVLTRITTETARAFYEIEAAHECWSVRQLERQIGSQLFERLANHRDPEKVLALARRGQEVAKPTDVIKDPFVLEFSRSG
jgi:predicted nuclease of restriction endonuclease-like (RecB) superfamily